MSATRNQRYVCVHGHFYQPPREHPALETVEVQDSAAPYHDWNERVTAESYAPNAAARLLDEHDAITALRNNYERISFNFGPTLLAWMERAQPQAYAQLLHADRVSARRLGRGNALAQVYGHCIMPLASQRDQQTQVRWGIADFVHRYGRFPDGMWLPETAVDRSTLATLADNGIRYTILAPSQAAQVRIGDGSWEEIRDGGLDCTRPYRCTVGTDLAVTIFFYDAEIAHAIAFGGLLNDGRELARRLTAAASDRPGPSLVHVATDGETYGHHHRFGEMALAAALESIEHEQHAQLTNYAAYLDQVPVHDEVMVREETSWSCAHGVERWRANCGCNAGRFPGGQQGWRTPLREALNWLQSQVDMLFERHGERVLGDPWAARDAYASVILQRDDAHKAAFLERHASRHLEGADRIYFWKLLEMQRHALLSFTSCGWFFDEPSAIETVQILAYAARAMQLAEDFGVRLEPEFLRYLEPMRSNLPKYADGRHLYAELVRPLRVDGQRRAAHFAMTSLFEPPVPVSNAYAHRLTSLDRTHEKTGAASFAVGRVQLVSQVTDANEEYIYAALHLGVHDVHCAVAAANNVTDYAGLQTALMTTFFADPVGELVRRIDQFFGPTFYTLRDVFLDERRCLLERVTAQIAAGCTADYERMVINNRRLLDFLAHAGVPLPQELRMAATHVLQRRLEDAVARFVAQGDGTAPRSVLSDARRWGIAPATDGARRILAQALTRAVIKIGDEDPESATHQAHDVLDLAQSLDLTLDVWEAQNRYCALVVTPHQRHWTTKPLGELRRLGERLSFQLREWEE